MARFALLVVLALAGPRVVAAEEGVVAVRLVLGETREIEVGFARMFRCDDLAVVGGEMRDKNAATNVFVVTGKQVGTTQCRVGLEVNRPSLLFSITVEKPASKR